MLVSTEGNKCNVFPEEQNNKWREGEKPMLKKTLVNSARDKIGDKICTEVRALDDSVGKIKNTNPRSSI